jgi:ATP phosphoribosyltransferase regulatory subunit HisZ
MTSVVQIEIELPDDLAQFQLPEGVQERLTTLLDKQDGGELLTDSEQREAEGLVNLADLLSLLGLRADRISYRSR